jgi:hypothetical protein
MRSRRELLVGIAGVSAISFLHPRHALAFQILQGSNQKTPNRVVQENSLPGTSSWILTNPPTVLAQYPPGDIDRVTNRCPVIEGYAWPPTVNIGETISFYVSTSSPSYSLEIYRMGYYGGLGGRAMSGPWYGLTVGGSGDRQPDPPTNGDASTWNPSILGGNTKFQVPSHWASGCFVAKLQASNGTQSYIFFVVRDDFRASELLMQSSLTTYHAYNGWNGDSVYAYNNPDDQWRNNGEVIWLKRPFLPSSSPNGRYGAGAGAFFTHDKGPGGPSTWSPSRPEADMYSASAWEYSMVRWLEKEGYDVSYCTNLDTDQNQLGRSSHRIFLSVGHDEYWSLNAYNNVVSARDHGVSLLWFSGNTVWNCVDLSHDGQMRVVGNFNPANAGTSNPPLPVTDYGLVGGTWVGGSPIQWDLQVQYDCPVWLTNGVMLRNYTVLGNLIDGYEVNGLDRTHPEWDYLLPPGMEIILGSLNGEIGQSVWYTSRSSGATVVSLGTVQWSWGLDDFTLEVSAAGPFPPNLRNRADQGVQQFTRNLIGHCTDSTNMVVDLADGTYEVQSVSAFPQNLIVTNNGAPNAPVIVYGDGAWRSSNNQARWIVQKYMGPRTLQPVIGPYKAAGDMWYTIRNAQNGQHLIVGDNGVQNGPVEVYGYPYSNWGQHPDNTQMMWRIWRYISFPSIKPVYLLQNVCCGQLLIVGENGRKDGPVWAFGSYNGGWGEAEHNPQKLWVFKLVRP